MAARRFELPGIQDLSKEQEAVRALPKKGQHLVVGGPGTGKSVLALIRARRHRGDRDDYRFLVFNHLLDCASGQLFSGDLVSRTWDGWFRETFREITGESVPLREPNDNRYREIDWKGVDAALQTPSAKDADRRPFLVIDEGQDMPRAFYRALIRLGFENFFVVADQNQQITEANSTRQDIQNCLALEAGAVIELLRNYRNGYHVARLAGTFRTDDPASPQLALPAPSPGPVPLLYRYDERELDAVAAGILRMADRDPRQLIGVIAPNNKVRERYLHALRSAEVRLDNPPPAVRTFHADDRSEVAFDAGGILVINAQACKGLEFDTVVLADIDEHYFRRSDPDVTKRLFYVMVARAKERVFLFMRRGKGREVEEILPSNEDVLRRQEL